MRYPAGTVLITFLIALFVALVCVGQFTGSAAAQKEGDELWMVFTPGANLYRLKPGVEATSYLELHNNSYRTVTDIRLSADIPEGWSARFRPDTVAKLEAGNIATVDVIIMPAKSAARGDYQLAVIAETAGIRRVNSVYVNVQPDTSFWLWPTIGLAALLIAGFVFIFVRFGRG
jgi:uncharacterized membrane protein